MMVFVVITFTLFLFIVGCVGLWAVVYHWMETRSAKAQQVSEEITRIAELLPRVSWSDKDSAASEAQTRISNAQRLLRGFW